MPTSGVIDWTLTARDIIKTALTENGIVGLQEEPTATEAEACMRRLNGLLQSWSIGLHYEAEANVTVPADTPSGTVGSDVETILSARYVESATNERQLQRFERDDYLVLPNKSASGTPSLFYVSENTEICTIHLWPVPTAESTIKINYLRKPEVVTDLGETVDFPQKYHEALYANLALRCAGIFGAPPTPELIARARQLETEMRDAERPASYFMESC